MVKISRFESKIFRSILYRFISKNIDKLDKTWYAIRNVGLIKKKLYEIVNVI